MALQPSGGGRGGGMGQDGGHGQGPQAQAEGRQGQMQANCLLVTPPTPWKELAEEVGSGCGCLQSKTCTVREEEAQVTWEQECWGGGWTARHGGDAFEHPTYYIWDLLCHLGQGHLGQDQSQLGI